MELLTRWGVSRLLLSTVAIAPIALTTANAQVDEIVVTAQKRSQSAQDVPISISALDGEGLRDRGVADASDIVGQFPNVGTSANNAVNTNFNIRGIATDNFQGNVNRSVGVYIDDVTQAHAFTGVYGVFDTERVEVLRGPQNTLNGRNTTGGAINFISVKPEAGGEFNGYGQFTYGRFNQVIAEGAIGGGLGDNAGFRIAGQVQFRDGPFTNIAPGREGEELGETEKYSARAQLLWTPSGRTEVLTQFRVGFDRGTGIGNLVNGVLDPNQDLSLAAVNQGPPGFDNVPLALCDQIETAGDFASGNPSPCVTIFGNTGSDNFREVRNVSSAQKDVDVIGGTIRIDHDFGGATLTSITAYDHVELNLADETLGTERLQFLPFQDSTHDAFQQEIRLVSADDQPFRWIVGGYFFREELEQSVAVRQDQNPLNTAPPPTFGQLITPFNILDQVDRDISAFAQADWDITDRLTLSGGLRYTNNRKTADSFFGIILTPIVDSTVVGPRGALGSLSGIPLAEFIGVDFILNTLESYAGALGTPLPAIGMGPPPFIAANFSDGDFFGVPPSVTPAGTGALLQDIDRITGDATIQYDITDSANVFFRYARGFKSGAFDTRALAALQGAGANAPVGPETLNAYEIGLKSNPSDKLQFNASAFYYDQKDLQVFSVGPLGPQFLNVPSSRVIGIEADAIWAPTPTTTIRAAAGWLDTEVTDDGGLAGVDEGHELRNAPSLSANLIGSQDFDLGGNRANLQVAFRYIGEQADSLNFNEDILATKPVQTYVDIRASYYFGDEEQYFVAAFGKNLTGEEFCGDLGSVSQPIESVGGLANAINGGTIFADNPTGQSNNCQPGNEGTPLWGVSIGGSF